MKMFITFWMIRWKLQLSECFFYLVMAGGWSGRGILQTMEGTMSAGGARGIETPRIRNFRSKLFNKHQSQVLNKGVAYKSHCFSGDYGEKLPVLNWFQI